ncbi:unnamed protein product, partial [Mesorhabditis belari]|uniref:Uncharacterized protein n=1 Tax=Mesorhabditis belari TaxID=2138241 RepID=A0AAF3FEB1_9BILA
MDYVSAVHWDENYYKNATAIWQQPRQALMNAPSGFRSELVATSFGLKMAMFMEIFMTLCFWRVFIKIWHDQIAGFLRSVAIPLTCATINRFFDLFIYVVTSNPCEFLSGIDQCLVLTAMLSFCTGALTYSSFIYRSVESNSHESGGPTFIAILVLCSLISVTIVASWASSIVMFSSIVANTIISYSILVVPVFIYTLIISVFPKNRSDTSADGLARGAAINRSRFQIAFICLAAVLLYQSWIESTSRLLYFFSQSLKPWMMSTAYNTMPWVINQAAHYSVGYFEMSIINQLCFPIVFYMSIFIFMKPWRDALNGNTMNETTLDVFKFEPNVLTARRGFPDAALGNGGRLDGNEMRGIDPPPTYQEALQMSPQDGNASTVPPSSPRLANPSNPPIAAPPYTETPRPPIVYPTYPIQNIDPQWLHYNGAQNHHLRPNYPFHPTQMQRSGIFGQMFSQYPEIIDESCLDGLPGGASPVPVFVSSPPPPTSQSPGPSTSQPTDFTEDRLQKNNFPNKASISVRVMSAPVRRSPHTEHTFKPLPSLKE